MLQVREKTALHSYFTHLLKRIFPPLRKLLPLLHLLLLRNYSSVGPFSLFWIILLIREESNDKYQLRTKLCAAQIDWIRESIARR